MSCISALRNNFGAHKTVAQQAQIDALDNEHFICPETSSMIGFGIALLLNGIGVVGSGYYLRKKHIKASAGRSSGTKLLRLPFYLDAAVSAVTALFLCPVALLITIRGAFKSSNPTIYGRTQ